MKITDGDVNVNIKEIKKNLENFYIFRTSWVYGKFGKNFPKTIIDLMQTKEELNIGFSRFESESRNVYSRMIKINSSKYENLFCIKIAELDMETLTALGFIN